MSENQCGISFLIHGPSKSGKTWLGESAPGPRLILDAEGGTRFCKTKKTFWDPSQPPPEYDGSWETCISYIRDFGTLSHAYQWLASGHHSFRSVILDSLSEAQQRCVDAIAGAEQMRIQDWGELYRKVAQLVRQYRDLLVHPTNPIDAVVLIAMTKQSEDGKFYPFVQGQLATALPYFIDVVGYLKAAYTDEGEFNNYLLVKPHLQYEAGDRTGIFPQILTNPRIDIMIQQFCTSEEETND